MDEKHRIEAVLFTTGRFMTVDEISSATGLGSVGIVKELLDQLRQEYEERPSALILQEHEGRYKLNIRKEFGYLANKLIATTEMDKPTIKTLAIIAYRNPVLQSEVIKIRRNKAYDHIHILKEQNLISAEKQGRTNLIKLTPHFFEYFDTAAEHVKQAFTEATPQQAQPQPTLPASPPFESVPEPTVPESPSPPEQPKD